MFVSSSCRDWTRDERREELEQLQDMGWNDFYFFTHNDHGRYGIDCICIETQVTVSFWNWNDVSNWCAAQVEAAEEQRANSL